MRALRSPLGAGGREALFKGRSNRGLDERPGVPSAGHLGLKVQVFGEVAGSFRIDREFGHVFQARQVAHEHVGPPFGVTSEPVQLDAQFCRNGRALQEQRGEPDGGPRGGR